MKPKTKERPTPCEIDGRAHDLAGRVNQPSSLNTVQSAQASQAASTPPNPPRRVKKRNRWSDDKLEEVKKAIIKVAEEMGPINSRGISYQLETVWGLINKTETDFGKVERLVGELRLAGRLDWDLIIDNTRSRICPPTFTDAADALEDTQLIFRLNLWLSQPVFLQVWIEKGGLAPVFEEVTDKYVVPLYPADGFPSLTFTKDAAREAQEALDERGQKPVVLIFGDYDPSGSWIVKTVQKHYQHHQKEGIEFVLAGLNPEQIAAWKLPTRPTKESSHSKNWNGDNSVELDAVGFDRLKKWTEDEIRKYIDWPLWQKTMDREAEQRRKLNEFVKKM